MIVSHESRNCAVLTNGKKTTVLRYDADHLRKYSELFNLPGWTVEKVYKELREDIETEISTAFPDEAPAFIAQVVSLVMRYASANVHHPREEVLDGAPAAK